MPVTVRVMDSYDEVEVVISAHVVRYDSPPCQPLYDLYMPT